MRAGLRLGAALAVAAAVAAGGCAGGDDGSTAPSTSAERSTGTGGSDGSDGDGAARAARDEAATGGDAIVPDGSIEVPGVDGGTAVYEVRDLRLTEPTAATDCPGGTPVSARRLAADLTAYLVPSPDGDPNVVADDEPLPIPYVSQLPEIVRVGVGADDVADDRWFVSISPVSRLLRSAPNTFLRPAPAGPASDCAIAGWEPTDLAEPVVSTEMLALSSGFVPEAFDPADYQFRIGRGDDFAYCWPLDDLGTPAELGRCA